MRGMVKLVEFLWKVQVEQEQCFNHIKDLHWISWKVFSPLWFDFHTKFTWMQLILGLPSKSSLQSSCTWPVKHFTISWLLPTKPAAHLRKVRSGAPARKCERRARFSCCSARQSRRSRPVSFALSTSVQSRWPMRWLRCRSVSNFVIFSFNSFLF